MLQYSKFGLTSRFLSSLVHRQLLPTYSVDQEFSHRYKPLHPQILDENGNLPVQCNRMAFFVISFAFTVFDLHYRVHEWSPPLNKSSNKSKLFFTNGVVASSAYTDVFEICLFDPALTKAARNPDPIIKKGIQLSVPPLLPFGSSTDPMHTSCKTIPDDIVCFQLFNGHRGNLYSLMVSSNNTLFVINSFQANETIHANRIDKSATNTQSNTNRSRLPQSVPDRHGNKQFSTAATREAVTRIHLNATANVTPKRALIIPFQFALSSSDAISKNRSLQWHLIFLLSDYSALINVVAYNESKHQLHHIILSKTYSLSDMRLDQDETRLHTVIYSEANKAMHYYNTECPVVTINPDTDDDQIVMILQNHVEKLLDHLSNTGPTSSLSVKDSHITNIDHLTINLLRPIVESGKASSAAIIAKRSLMQDRYNTDTDTPIAPPSSLCPLILFTSSNHTNFVTTFNLHALNTITKNEQIITWTPNEGAITGLCPSSTDRSVIVGIQDSSTRKHLIFEFIRPVP